jgi:hypothetical protein
MKAIWYALAATLLVGTGVALAGERSSTTDPVTLSPQYYTVKADDERIRAKDWPGHFDRGGNQGVDHGTTRRAPREKFPG